MTLGLNLPFKKITGEGLQKKVKRYQVYLTEKANGGRTQDITDNPYRSSWKENLFPKPFAFWDVPLFKGTSITRDQSHGNGTMLGLTSGCVVPQKPKNWDVVPVSKKSRFHKLQFNFLWAVFVLLWPKNPRGCLFRPKFLSPKTARTYLKVGWGAWTSNARSWFCSVVGGGKLTGWKSGWFLVWDDVGMFPFTPCCLGWLGQLGMYWFRCIG